MKISLRLLDDVQGVNSMEAATQVCVTAGDPTTLNIQLIDALRYKMGQGDAPAVRYMPEAGAELTLVFDSVDTAKRVTKVASQPFTQDPSIWRVTLQQIDTDKLLGTVALAFTLVEGDVTRTGRVLAALAVT